ncbi:MAG: hypothetical protein WC829_21015 [Hyphomicrobium sp.]|jgi:hypothetical protein
MRSTTSHDLAAVCKFTPGDLNNFLKRYVHPDIIPEVAPGHRRPISERAAKVAVFAVEARDAGFSPEQVRAITRRHFRAIERDDAIAAVLTKDGGCQIVTSVEVSALTIEELLMPYAQAGQRWVRVILMRDLKSKVELALNTTERGTKARVDLLDMLQEHRAKH